MHAVSGCATRDDILEKQCNYHPTHLLHAAGRCATRDVYSKRKIQMDLIFLKNRIKWSSGHEQHVMKTLINKDKIDDNKKTVIQLHSQYFCNYGIQNMKLLCKDIVALKKITLAVHNLNLHQRGIMFHNKNIRFT